MRLGFASGGFGWPVELAITCTQALCVIFQALLRITQNLVRCLNGLKLCNHFLFMALISIRVEFESYADHISFIELEPSEHRALGERDSHLISEIAS